MVRRPLIYGLMLFVLLGAALLPAASARSLLVRAGSRAPVLQTSAPRQTSGQLRAFWADAWNNGFKSPVQIAQLIADAHTANANALFVQVRRRGDSYHNESVEPRADDGGLDPEPFDPLAELIAAAHDANPPLQVHAWVVVFPVWTPTYSTTDPERHVYFRHGEGRAWEDPDNWLTYRYEGGNLGADYQLDPGHPDAARYTVDVCLYLARHYDIDGLHLDYIRYYGQDYGYNQASVDRFHAAYGGSGLPDPAGENWKSWRREQVTAVVRRIYLESLAVKPDLIVSAATIAWGDGPDDSGGWENSSAYRSVFQDWRAWLEEGILDLVVPMNYDREHEPAQQQYFEHWIEWEKDHQYDRGLVVGQGAWLNYIEGTLAQAHKVLAPSSAGHEALGLTFYSYAHTNKDNGQPNSVFYAALSQPSAYGSPPFPTWVDPPSLPWKASPSKGHLLGWAIGPAGPLDRATVTLSGPENRTLRTDGNGFFGAVDLAPGSYTVVLPSPASSPLYATVEAGQVALATVAPPAAEPATRALLVEAGFDGIKTPDQVDLLLADARAAHLNTLIVQVRRNGQRYYESSIEPRANDDELASNFDPLAYLLAKAKEPQLNDMPNSTLCGRTPNARCGSYLLLSPKAGNSPLEVYAWLTVLPVWDDDLSQVPPGHVLEQNLDWLSQDYTANQLAAEGYYLDPGHPGVLTYTVDLALDLLNRYDVDGLFLDGLRYPADGASVGYPTWGYNPTAVLRFRARYECGDPAPDDALWMDWRREQVSALLRQLYLRCTELRPRLRIAVSGVAWGEGPEQAGGWEQSSAYGRVLQDWRAWLEEGIVDLAAPQNYDREYSADQRAWYDQWLSWEQANAGDRGILVLQGAYLNYPEHSLEQAGRVPGDAVAFASYIPANLYADPEGNSRWITPPRQPWYHTPEAEWWLWRALALPYGYTDPTDGVFTPTAPLFPGTVATPTLSWKDAPTLGHAAGWALGVGSAPLDGVTVTLSGPEARLLHSDGSGFFGAVDLLPGNYVARVATAAAPFDCLYAQVGPGQVVGFAPCRPLESVHVAGPRRLSLGHAADYGASYAPPTATLPVTFTWDNGAVGPLASYLWMTLGTHTLTVTASNPRGEVQGILAVEVFCQSPEGLDLIGPPSLLVGQVGIYQAAAQPLTASLPLTFTWDKGNMGTTVAYSWTLPGTYSLAVTVTNMCGSAGGSRQVRVLESWPVEAYLPLVARALTVRERFAFGIGSTSWDFLCALAFLR